MNTIALLCGMIKIDVAKQLVDFDHNSIHDIIGLCSGQIDETLLNRV